MEWPIEHQNGAHTQSSWMSSCDKKRASIKLTKYPKIGANNAEDNGAIAITSPVIYGGAPLSAAWMVKDRFRSIMLPHAIQKAL